MTAGTAVGGVRRPAVFLDRDGVLNRAFVRDGTPHPPAGLDDFQVLPGVPEACDRLRAAGFVLIVVTNQPDIARGKQTVEGVERLHEELLTRVRLDAVYVCPHDDPDEAGCRKPAPGLLIRAATEWGVSLRDSWMVGDRWRDIEAGDRAGCRTVFIDHHYRERRPTEAAAEVPDLASAAAFILTSSSLTSLVHLQASSQELDHE